MLWQAAYGLMVKGSGPVFQPGFFITNSISDSDCGN
jgi:hypothetical protein